MRVLALAAALGILVCSAPAMASVSRERLPNGVRLIVREDLRVGLVAVSLQVAGGSGQEATHEAGLTSLVQRVMVRGAGRWTAEGLEEAAEAIGGGIEAWADVDYAEIRASALAPHWERLLAMVADVALSPTFPLAEIERERRLIVAQLRTRTDTPFPHAFDTLMGRLFRGHPYGSSPLGRVETVAALSREMLAKRHAATYRPDRMVVAVSGRVDSGKVLRAASRMFGHLVPTPPVPLPLVPDAVPEAGRDVVERPAQQAQILVGYPVPGLRHTDYPAIRVLGAVLGSGMAGRLFVALRDTLGLAYAVGVLAPFRVGPAYLVAHLGTSADSAGVAEAGILRELERIRTEGPADAEVERATSYLLGALALDRLSNPRHAWYLAFGELHGLGGDFPDSYARALAAVTTAQVRAAAARYLVRPTVVTLVPR
jgi:zinc protease